MTIVIHCDVDRISRVLLLNTTCQISDFIVRPRSLGDARLSPTTTLVIAQRGGKGEWIPNSQRLGARQSAKVDHSLVQVFFHGT